MFARSLVSAWYARPVRALSVRPGQASSLEASDIDEPPPSDGEVLVDVVAVGICGTDIEIVAGEYGEAPPGRDRLVLGHESLGRVADAPSGSPVAPGDLVVAMVRHPDPVPCENCASGRWDMCRNGRYTEHGIKGVDGFMRERYRVPVERLVKLDSGLASTGVLLEPTSVVAKAWTEVDRFASRAAYQPRVVLVTGAGPIGLLAALLGTQRGLEVHVLDRVTEGVKPALVRELGATYHATAATETGLQPDVVIECTGVPTVVIEAMSITAVDGITCLTGVSATQRAAPGGRRCAQPRDRAGERHHLRLGQRGPQPLRGRRRGARQRRPVMARTAHHPPSSIRAVCGGAEPRARRCEGGARLLRLMSRPPLEGW